MKQALLWLVILASTCGPALAADDVVFLPRIVGWEGNMTYPDPVKAIDSDQVRNIDDALALLLAAVPFEVDGWVRDRRACDFQSEQALRSGFVRCLEAACQAIPEGSRDERSCGYLIRLAQWQQRELLGGDCAFHAEGTPLYRWFVAEGIRQCHAMSDALLVLLLQKVAGSEQPMAATLHLFRD